MGAARTDEFRASWQSEQEMSSSPAIEAEGLVKHFGETRAVDGVDLSVAQGAVYGVLGPNGAGKTTTIRMIAGLLKPTAGHILVNGHDLAVSPEAALCDGPQALYARDFAAFADRVAAHAALDGRSLA